MVNFRISDCTAAPNSIGTTVKRDPNSGGNAQKMKGMKGLRAEGLRASDKEIRAEGLGQSDKGTMRRRMRFKGLGQSDKGTMKEV